MYASNKTLIALVEREKNGEKGKKGGKGKIT